MSKTLIVYTENKDKLKRLFQNINKLSVRIDLELFLYSKGYSPWEDEELKKEIVSFKSYNAYITQKSKIDSIIETIYKVKTDDVLIVDENLEKVGEEYFDDNNFDYLLSNRKELLRLNFDTKYETIKWFIIDLLSQKNKKEINISDNTSDSIRYHEKIKSITFFEKIIHIDGGLGDHVMALPLLEKLQNEIYLCCKSPFMFEHLNVKGVIPWNDPLFGGYNRFVYEYGSTNNSKTIIDAFFEMYGYDRTNEDILKYNGKKESNDDINSFGKKISLICTSAAKIQGIDSNKDWKDVRWLNLVNELKKKNYFVIQVGTSKDNQIPTVDLKFLDKPISNIASLIESSSLWISVDTFFHHFASSIKPEVGICLTPYYNDHAKHNGVTYIEKDCGKNYWDRRWWMDLQQPERKECMDLIKLEDVVNVIKKKIKIKIYCNDPNIDNCSNWRGHMQYNGIDGIDAEFSNVLDFKISEDIKYDIVIMIRPLRGLIDYIRNLKKNGVKVVVDYDDSLPLSFSSKNIVEEMLEVLQIMNECDALVTTTERLKNYYYYHSYNENINVIPNIIDNNFISDNKKDNGDKIILGWFGNSGHYENLKLINKTVLKILDEYPNVYLNIYSDTEKIFDLFNHPKTTNINYEFNFKNFQEKIGEIDINLAPLTENYFSLHKSNIRIILSGYKRIPSICTNFGEYKLLGKDNVILCDDENDWYYGLKELIENQEFRFNIGNNIRKYIDKNLISEKWKKNKYEMFDSLVNKN